LYVVATPIGNLEDITLRALRILGEVELIAAEDTRTARKLLTKYNIGTRLTSYFEHNQKLKLSLLLDTLENADVALISEAGMPGISDPGYDLVRGAIKNGYKVIPVPGSSAVVAALAAAGMPADQFVFLGFLPRKPGERKRLLQSVSDESRTVVCFESPHRLLKALNDIRDELGDRRIAVCRELTKIYEEIFRGTVSEAIAYFLKPRGEFTLVIEGAGKLKKGLPGTKKKQRSGERTCS
jgi:16S rRNA (cytidine1402-2'-O)-methyltransferase